MIARLDAETTCRAWSVRDDHPTLVWHYHHELEVFAATQGAGHFLIGNISGEFRAGDVYLIGAKTPHAFYINDEAKPALHYVLAMLKPALFTRKPTAPRELATLAPLAKGPNFALRFKGRGSPQAISALGSAAEAHQAGCGLNTLIHVLQALSVLTHSRAEPLESSDIASADNSDATRMDHIYRYLHAHYTSNVTLADVANHVSLSASATTAMFRKATGRSIMRYIEDMRIGRARALLTQTARPITEIAFDCGYGSLSSFNRQFLRLVGSSPTQFRRRHRGPG